jgi:GT2 family glycosyltransferase
MSSSTVVIILNWNSKDLTAQCIRSVLAMNTRDHDTIVVDNGSRDGSVEYLRREFPQIVVLPQERNLGFAAGCNVGIKEALKRGAEYVLPLNNDAIVDSNMIEALLEVAEKHPSAAIVSPKIYFYDSPNRFWWAGGSFSLWTGIPKHVGRKDRDNGQFEATRTLDWATGCAALMRCEALKHVGLFEEQLFGNGEDLDLSLRVRRAGFEIWFAPKARVWHKEGVDYRKNAGENLRIFMGTRNMLWIMRKYASPTQWLTCGPNFLVRHALFYIALSLLRGDWRTAAAVPRGVAAFFRMGRVHDPSPATTADMIARKAVERVSRNV